MTSEERRPTTASDVRELLSTWGDGIAGPHNGDVGPLLLECITDIVRKQPDVRSVCDLGCGNGFLAHRLGTLGYNVLGLDASERLLAVARAHYRSERVGFEKHVFGDVVPDAMPRFDMAISVDVIEHLYRPEALLETADHVLKPGGRLIVATPYHGYLKNVAISMLNRWDDHHHVHFDGGHIKFFSVATLTAMVRKRFTVTGVEYYGRFPGFWKNMIVTARKPES